MGLTLEERETGGVLDPAPFKELLASLGEELKKAGEEALMVKLSEPLALDSLEAEPYVQALTSVRGELRKARQWALADKIRDQLEELGVTLEDTSGGTIWKRRQPGGEP